MISPRFFEVASSYSTFTARMLAPVGPSILPRSTIAALPASSARVTSWVFFLGGIAFRAPSCVLHGLKLGAARATERTTTPRPYNRALNRVKTAGLSHGFRRQV